MNTYGYQIMHIGDGIENNSTSITIVKANPIHKDCINVAYTLYQEWFTPYICEETEWFLFPDRQDIINRLIEIMNEGIWYPNCVEYKDEFIRDGDANRRMLIHRHVSFWDNNYNSVSNNSKTISRIPDIE